MVTTSSTPPPSSAPPQDRREQAPRHKKQVVGSSPVVTSAGPIFETKATTSQLAIGTNPWADWSEHQNSIQRRKVSELDKYLEEEILPVGIPLDILQYWKTSSGTYPILACVARDMLAIPASTVALESAFSSGERIICDYRSRLTSETVEALIFQDWLKGDDPITPEEIYSWMYNWR
ncbi:unnamed protein product [Urochloa humidicola]